MREIKLKLGSKHNNRNYINGVVKPGNKFWKRKSAKKVRKSKNIANGNNYKKIWGWFEWC